MKSGVVILLSVLFVACQPGVEHEEMPSTARPDAGGSTSVYSYVDDRGRIQMAKSIDEIPAAFRGQVVVTDTGKDRLARLESDRAIVLDLREHREGQPLNYSLVDLDKVIARRPSPAATDEPGSLGRRLVGQGADGVRSLLGLEPLRAPADVVLLYTAPWCGFCKKAAAYLRKKGVAFEERDIEASRNAALELDRKLRAAGMVGGGIPVLDIGGTIVIGFDRARIDRLLERG